MAKSPNDQTFDGFGAEMAPRFGGPATRNGWDIPSVIWKRVCYGSHGPVVKHGELSMAMFFVTIRISWWFVLSSDSHEDDRRLDITGWFTSGRWSRAPVEDHVYCRSSEPSNPPRSKDVGVSWHVEAPRSVGFPRWMIYLVPCLSFFLQHFLVELYELYPRSLHSSTFFSTSFFHHVFTMFHHFFIIFHHFPAFSQHFPPCSHHFVHVFFQFQ